MDPLYKWDEQVIEDKEVDELKRNMESFAVLTKQTDTLLRSEVETNSQGIIRTKSNQK